MRPEDQEHILNTLETRVAMEQIQQSHRRGLALHELLEDSLYFEERRLQDNHGAPNRDRDRAFWSQLRRDLRGSSEAEQKALLQRVVRHYGEEISGNFDPRVYRLATRALPTGLNIILNATSPLKLVTRLGDRRPNLEDTVVIQGETDHFRSLRDHGTLILVPTHVSNLDSVVVGYSLYRLGVPPFVYGAGLNLFNNPLTSFFMHNLGAYTVDRKKTDPTYKTTLKEYATLTMEHGYDNIFFPGGTRSRSGAVERRLKLGLLGSGLASYINQLKESAPKPKVFIVPATLSFELVLEAETLIDDFLKEVGKSRYIIDDDEFMKPKRVLEFMRQLFGLDARIHVTLSRGMDPFGNPVDDDGTSLDPCGRAIDIARYTFVNGAPDHDAARDAEYTREVGRRIAEAFATDNVVAQTHVTAFAIFGLLQKRNPRMSVLRLIRTGGEEDDLEIGIVYTEVQRLIEELKKLQAQKKIRLSTALSESAEDVVNDALARFSTYHTRRAFERRGDRIVPADRNLLLYYQNRLEGYGLRNTNCLSHDHRALDEEVR